MEMLPSHLKKYVVEQNYEKYSPVDQAVWRFILRQLKSFLSKNAHECYLEGLQKTGIEIERIPRITDVSDKLSQFGWRAIPVSGFIPPAAFMELQSLGVLPVASEIRSLDHLLYTPAPDIVHEAAGHAPILINLEFATYLKKYAQVAKKSIMSSQDLELYEAIRLLSDLKEHPDSTANEIAAAEENLAAVSKSITHISEASELSRMNWWTAEYGLIGSLENPKLFGAGLLSSVGESKWCLSQKVKKIPLSVDCVKQGYDITEPQPQLFVTPSFQHLSEVLEDFAQQMAFNVGGLKGLQKALDAKSVNTAELDSGLQLSGIVSEAITDHNGTLTYLRLAGPSQLSFQDQELSGHHKSYHSHGFGTPIGFLKAFPKISPCDLSDQQWATLGFIFDGELGDGPGIQKSKSSDIVFLEYQSGVILTAVPKSRWVQNGKTILVTLNDARVELDGRVLYEPSWGPFDMALGASVVSVFGGAADREKYGDSDDFKVARVSSPKWDAKELDRHSVYQKLRDLREKNTPANELLLGLRSVFTKQQQDFPDDWLLELEILEILLNKKLDMNFQNVLTSEIQKLAVKFPEKKDIILDGLNLAAQEALEKVGP